MIEKLKSFYKRYMLPQELSEKIHQEDKLYLRRIYIFSLLFGLMNLVIGFAAATKTEEFFRIAYYGLYVIIGVIGIVLCAIPKLRYTPLIMTVLFFFIMLTYYVIICTFSEFLLFYVCFSFCLVMMVNINPFTFFASVMLYDVFLALLQRFRFFEMSSAASGSAVYNIAVINVLILYLAFWKRTYIINKFNTEKSIRQEKERTEKLLLNTLPQKVMEDLRDTGKSVPASFESATVLYCAISNYAELSASLDSGALISLFNKVYEAFDSIVEEECSLRIKTTGNIYMAVSGLPVPDENHAERMIKCAVRFLEFIDQCNASNNLKVRVKIGLHSGKVVAGIVGIKKYIYDVFGDTVNTACRMEMLCDDMKIRVSSGTYGLVKNKFSFVKQTPVMVKGKGILETYYIA